MGEAGRASPLRLGAAAAGCFGAIVSAAGGATRSIALTCSACTSSELATGPGFASARGHMSARCKSPASASGTGSTRNTGRLRRVEGVRIDNGGITELEGALGRPDKTP